MEQRRGWWSIDRESRALANGGTGQRIRHVGRAEDSGLGLVSSVHRYWMRFEYEDPECRYPLLVEWQNNPTVGNLRWRVDHVRSAALWRRLTSSPIGNPSFGLWRRVDDAIIDAFTTWPVFDDLGLAPSYIYINGGWANGSWTDQRFREFSEQTVLRDMGGRMRPFLMPLDEAAPAPWTFVAERPPSQNIVRSWLKSFRRSSSGESIEEIILRSDLQGLPDPAFCGAHLRSLDNRRAIVPVEFLSQNGDAEVGIVRLRLLYIDDDLICDCILAERHNPHTTIDTGTWTIEFKSRLTRLGNGGVAARRSGLTGQLLPLELPPSGPRYFGSESGQVVPRPALWYRLVHALSDALLQWRESSLSLPQSFLKDESPILVPTPKRIILLRTSPRVLPEEICTDTLESPFGDEAPSVIAFRDQQASAMPAQAIKRDVGWWSVDPQANIIKNTLSSQHIRVDEVLSTRGEMERKWRFIYHDDDIEFPVIVTRTLGKRPSHVVAGYWQIDHVRSADEWKVMTGRSDPVPPYGVWRRVDEAIADALYCWTELDALTHVADICSVGGWWNGSWHVDSRQLRGGIVRSRLEKLVGSCAQPVLEPLTSPPPASWRFVEDAKDVVRVELAHIRREAGAVPFLPDTSPLEGFQGRTSYLTRDDGKSVLFPAYAERGWKNSSYPDFADYYAGVGYFTYAGQDAFLTCRLGLNRDFLAFQIREFGLRGRIAPEQSVEEAVKDPFVLPARYSIWRNFVFDMMQAWPKWRGTGNRLLEDRTALDAFRMSGDKRSHLTPPWEKSGIALDTPQKVQLTGGYVGGIYTPYMSISADITRPTHAS